MSSNSIRTAAHAGSWYSNNPKTLSKQLDTWLNAAQIPSNIQQNIQSVQAIISPHAGYSYSGPTAAYAYTLLQLKLHSNVQIENIFILGPSHHYYTKQCEVTQFTQYGTPLGNIPINTELCNKLADSPHFKYMKSSVDEQEHSIELQLAYISHIMSQYNTQYKLVPILVGSLSSNSEQLYGELLSTYIQNRNNFFILSSDFCHWGQRFSYTYIDPQYQSQPIYKSIQYVDKQGMQAITHAVSHNDITEWYQYLNRTHNTICGRHPISVYIQAIIHVQQTSNNKYTLPFIAYTQSSHCQTPRDSSVSYGVGTCICCSTEIPYDVNQLAEPSVPAADED